MDIPSNDDTGSESENPDELGDQLSGPAISSFPFEDIEEAETRASVSASTGEADEGEASVFPFSEICSTCFTKRTIETCA